MDQMIQLFLTSFLSQRVVHLEVRSSQSRGVLALAKTFLRQQGLREVFARESEEISRTPHARVSVHTGHAAEHASLPMREEPYTPR